MTDILENQFKFCHVLALNIINTYLLTVSTTKIRLENQI